MLYKKCLCKMSEKVWEFTAMSGYISESEPTIIGFPYIENKTEFDVSHQVYRCIKNRITF